MKLVFVFVFICINKFVFADERYEHISDYEFNNNGNNKYRYSLNFICGENSREHEIFNGNFYLNFRRFLEKSLVYRINFENCRFHEIKHNFSNEFGNIHQFDIKNVELEKIEKKNFQNARKLKELIASNNQLTKIPSSAIFQLCGN